MKKLYTMSVLLALALTCFTACSDDDDDQPSVVPSATGTVTDQDGNQYPWVRIGNLDWTTQNARGGQPWIYQEYITNNGYSNEFDYDDEDEELALLQTNGNFYTLQQAIDSAPDGWRVPTDDDWKQLEAALGMDPSELDKTGWRQGAGFLMMQAASGTALAMGFAGQLAAYNTSAIDLFHRGDYGYYWTSTRDESTVSETAYIRKITPARNAVERGAVSINQRYLSVRYVRDAR